MGETGCQRRKYKSAFEDWVDPALGADTGLGQLMSSSVPSREALIKVPTQRSRPDRVQLGWLLRAVCRFCFCFWFPML